MIELACHTKACAPPPVGSGGSIAGSEPIEWKKNVYSDFSETFGSVAPVIPKSIVAWVAETGGPAARLLSLKFTSVNIYDMTPDEGVANIQQYAQELQEQDNDKTNALLWTELTNTRLARMALSEVLHDPNGPTPDEQRFYRFVHDAYLQRSAEMDRQNGHSTDLQRVMRSADTDDPFEPNRGWKERSTQPSSGGSGVTSWYARPSENPIPDAPQTTKDNTWWSGWVSKDQVLGRFGDTANELLVARDPSIIQRLTGRSATTASGVIELACRSKACAPPPVGSGGSIAGEFDIEWVEVRSDKEHPTNANLDYDESVWDNRVPKIPEPLLEWISKTGGPYQRLNEQNSEDAEYTTTSAMDMAGMAVEDPTRFTNILYGMMTQTEHARRALSLTLHDPEGPTPQEAEWYSFVHQAYLARSAQLGTPKNLQYVTRTTESSESSDDPFAPNDYWKSVSAAPDARGTGVTSWFGEVDPPASSESPKAGLTSGPATVGRFNEWQGWVSKDQVLGVFGDTPGELIVARDASIIDRLTGKAATTASGVIELACRSAECAPPPIGSGGSLPAGTGTAGATESGLEGLQTLDDALFGVVDGDGWEAAVDIMAAAISETSAKKFVDTFADEAAVAALSDSSLEVGGGPSFRKATAGMLNTRVRAWGGSTDTPAVLNAIGTYGMASPDLSNYTRFISHMDRMTYVYYLHNSLRSKKDGTWLIPPEMTEFGGPTDATGAESLGARRAIAAAIRGAWAQSARSPLSNLLSQSVAESGMASSDSWSALKGFLRPGSAEAMATIRGLRPAVDEAVKAAYSATQAQLKELGITEVTVYRGVRYEKLSGLPVGSSARISEAPLSSWSTSLTMAEDFAAQWDPIDRNRDQGLRVMEMTVPASRVFSTAWTGVGSQDESEVVLLGSDSDTARTFIPRAAMPTRDWGDPKPALAAAASSGTPIFLDADPDQHDWIKVVVDKNLPDTEAVTATIELACHSAECAPPPVGEGGSLPRGSGAVQRQPFTEGLSAWEPTNAWPQEQTLVDIFEQDLGNGVVAVIDEVIYPNENEAPEFTVLVGLSGASGKYVGEATRRIIFPDVEMTESDWSSTDIGPGVISHDEFRISEDRQGQGIGGAFIRRSMQAAADADFHTVSVDALSDGNSNGLYTWLRAGFEIESEPSDYRVESINKRMSAAGIAPRFTSDWSGRQLLDYLGPAAKDVLGASTEGSAALYLNYDLTQLRTPEAVAASAAMDQLTEALSEWLEPIIEESATASAMIELACYTKECAPPPTGTGGSSPAGTSSGSASGVTEEGLKGREKLHEAILPDDESEPDAWRKAVDIMSAGITEDSAQQFADVFAEASSDGGVRAALAGASLDADAGLRAETIGQLNSTLIKRAGKQWNADDYQPVLTASGMVGLKSPDLNNYTRFISHDSKSKATHVYYLHNGLKNEDGTWEIPEEMTEFGGPTDATGTESLGARRAIAAAIRGSWANSARSPLSNLASQEVASMGLASQNSWDSLQDYLGDFGIGQMTAVSTAMRPAVRQAVKASYDATQADLKSRGITSVTLYRGASYDPIFAASPGTTVPIREASLTSWSTNPYIADQFAGYSKGRVLEMTVPASRIFSTAQTGLGSQLEWEAVVLGSDSDSATVYDRRQDNEWGTVKPVAASASANDNAVFLDADPDHHDWIKVVGRNRGAGFLNAVTAACQSKECAPPPVGKGGSLPKGAAPLSVDMDYYATWKAYQRPTFMEMNSLHADETFVKTLQGHVAEAPVAVRMSSESFQSMAYDDPDPRIRNLYEVDPDAKGDEYLSVREDYDGTVGLRELNTVHGYSTYVGWVEREAGDGYAIDGQYADYYGEVELVLSDSVKDRSYFTVADSLDSKAIPMPIRGEIPPEHVATQLIDDGGYAEVQIPGPIPLSEIAEIRTTYAEHVFDAETLQRLVDRGLSPKTPIVDADTFAKGDVTVEDFIRDQTRAQSQTASATIELACHSKSCAPPPYGTGGSVSSGYAEAISEVRKRYAGREWEPNDRIGDRMDVELDDLFTEDTPPDDEEIWTTLTETQVSRQMVSRALKMENPDPLAIMVMQEMHRRVASELPENAQVMVWRAGRHDSDPFAPRSGPHGTVLRDEFDANTGTGVTSWWGPTPTDGLKPEDDWRIENNIRNGQMAPGENFQHKFRREAERRSDQQVYEEWVGSDRILGRFGDMRHSGELLVAHTPETIDRLMSGTFPIVPTENRVSDWGTVGSANVIELACRSKECAPPPVGTGGSSPQTGAKPLDVKMDDYTRAMSNAMYDPFGDRVSDADLTQVQEAVQQSPIAVRMDSHSFRAMSEGTGDIRNLHEVGIHKKGEHYYSIRKMYDDAVGLTPVRAVYGYSMADTVLKDGRVIKDDMAGVYGGIALVLEDSVRDRSYFTVNDSLNSHAIPLPIRGDAPAEHRATQRADPVGYAEVQIPGPITMAEVKEIHVPEGDAHLQLNANALVDLVRTGLDSSTPIVDRNGRTTVKELVDRMDADASQSQTASGVIELACRSKECAPPPVGTGGSTPGAAPLDIDMDKYNAWAAEQNPSLMQMQSLHADETFVKTLQGHVAEMPVAVRMTQDAFESMAHDDPDPHIRNLHDVDPDAKGEGYRVARVGYDEAVGLLDLNTVHGYSMYVAWVEREAGDGYAIDGGYADFYGEIELVLDDSVKDRSYFTVSDSLDSRAIPMPIRGAIPPEHVATQLIDDGGYAEVQVPGPIPMSEIKEIRVTEYEASDVLDSDTLSGLVRQGLSPDTLIVDANTFARGDMTVADFIDGMDRLK